VYNNAFLKLKLEGLADNGDELYNVANNATNVAYVLVILESFYFLYFGFYLVRLP
jgi:hypothetical protein